MNVEVQEVNVTGQCAWCLQSELQAFALVCPDHVNRWRNQQDELIADIRGLCRAVDEFDGARPESPRVVFLICTERAADWRRRALEAEARIAKAGQSLTS